MKHKILVADTLADEGLAALSAREDVALEIAIGLDEAALTERLRGCHALLVRSATKVTARALSQADQLQVIGRAGGALGVLALPLIFDRIAGSGPSGAVRLAFGMLVALAAAVVLVRLQGRLEGWKAGLIALTLVALYSMLRP